jgi:large subunit ribosomal protein L31e
LEKEGSDKHLEKEEELLEDEEEAKEKPEVDEETDEITKEPEILEEEAGEEATEGVSLEEEEGEEEAPARREEKKEEFVEERIYTIPLRRAWIMPPNKRAPRAIRMIKAFVQRHMKVGKEAVEEEVEKEEEEEKGNRIIISNEVNEEIWSRGIEKPPRKLRIRAAKDEEGNVTIFLA